MGAHGKRHLISEKNPGYPFLALPFQALGLLRVAPLFYGALGCLGLFAGARRWLGHWGGTWAGHPLLQLGRSTGLRLAGHDAHLHRRLADRGWRRRAALDDARHGANGPTSHHQNSDSGHLALGRTLAVHAPSGSKHPGKVSRGGGPMDGLTVPKMNID